jgi:hypothetical protein
MTYIYCIHSVNCCFSNKIAMLDTHTRIHFAIPIHRKNSWLLYYYTNYNLHWGNKRHLLLQIRKHGPVINNIYRHHPVFDVYEITLRTLCIATNTINCDVRSHMYCCSFLNLVQPREMFSMYYFNITFVSVLHNKSSYITGNISTQLLHCLNIF